jgi:hypothetical protein
MNTACRNHISTEGFLKKLLLGISLVPDKRNHM